MTGFSGHATIPVDMKHAIYITAAILLAVIASFLTFSYSQNAHSRDRELAKAESEILINKIVKLKEEAQDRETEKKAEEERSKPLVANMDTKTWKTYRNEEFGFEFRHPDNVEPHLVELLRQEVLDANKNGIPFWWNYFSKTYGMGPGTRPDRQVVYMDIPKIGYASFNMNSLLVASKADVSLWCRSEKEEASSTCDTQEPLYKDFMKPTRVGGLGALKYGDIEKECPTVVIHMKDIPNGKWNQFNSIVLDCYTPGMAGELPANVLFQEMLKSIKFFKPVPSKSVGE